MSASLLLAGFIPWRVFGGDLRRVDHRPRVDRSSSFGPPVSGFTWGERLLRPAAGDLPDFPRCRRSSSSCSSTTPSAATAFGTPTEGGAIGAFVVFCYRALRMACAGRSSSEALIETAKLSVMIFTIIWGVQIYVRFLGFADLPERLLRLDLLTGIKARC